MTKRFLLLTGSVFLMASCSNSNDEQQLQQHIIDSTVNVKLSQRAAENAAKNDSTLRALAKQKADTMEQEQQGGQKKAKK